MGKAARTPAPPPLPPDPDGPITYPIGIDALSDADLGITKACDLEPEPIEWDWEGRMAAGKLSITAGEGSDGKSTVAMRLIASFTSGADLPDGTRPGRVGPCIILAAEDGAKDTILPRLAAVGADVNLVTILDPKVKMKGKDGKPSIDPKSFQDLDYWRVVIGRHPGLVMVIADPVPAYLGRGINDHKNAELRAVLTPLLTLLEEHRVTLLGITHVGKSVDARSPIDRLLGSVAYRNLARTVHMTARDPDDPDRRLLFLVKCNLAREKRTALAYRIEEHKYDHKGRTITTARAVFEAGDVVADISEAMAGDKGARKRGPDPARTTEVAAWLHDYLRALPVPVPLGAIFDAAGEAGLIGKRTNEGKWSSGSLLYQAATRIPELPEPRDGRRIDTSKPRTGRAGRPIVHWKLAHITDPEPGGDL